VLKETTVQVNMQIIWEAFLSPVALWLNSRS